MGKDRVASAKELRLELRRVRSKLDAAQSLNFYAVLFMIVFFAIMLWLAASMGDNIDVDDSLAPLLCKKLNMTVDAVGYVKKTMFSAEQLVITCKEPEVTPPTQYEPVIDGFLRIKKRSG